MRRKATNEITDCHRIYNTIGRNVITSRVAFEFCISSFLQNQILNRQLKRMDAENASLKERLDDDDKYENELKGQLKEAERREADLLSKVNK